MIRVLSPGEMGDPKLVELLVATVNAGASVSFVAPLSQEAASSYWLSVAEQVARGERIVLATDDLTGCIHLVLATQPNGLHRAEVQKMLVHPAARRQGLGRSLLAAAEAHARTIGRTLLVLDTEQGSAGEDLYRACGWQRVGTIPDFALNGAGTALIPTVFFYKLLS
ncbi:MAG: GNAT family N-acetyltransferase [Mycobacteriales bacterium]